MATEGTSDSSTPFKSETDLIADQISQLLTVETSEQEKKLNEEVEAMLVKITEFMEVVEMIRCDTNICVNSTLPLVTEKSKQLEQTFANIDKLEVLVAHVDATLRKLESQADFAEKHLGTFSTIKKKLFGALSSLGRKNQDSSVQQSSPGDWGQSYEPTQVYNTADFFPTATQ